MRALFLLLVVGALVAGGYYYFRDSLPPQVTTWMAAQLGAGTGGSTAGDQAAPSNSARQTAAKPSSPSVQSEPVHIEMRQVKDEYPYLVANGEVYEKVTVTAVYADSIAITHRTGMARIPTATLKPSLQEKYVLELPPTGLPPTAAVVETVSQ